MIGDEVEVTIVDVRGDKVRLGITAPARIAVHRKEVYEAIRAENEQASKATPALDSLKAPLSPGPARLRASTSRLITPSAPAADRGEPARRRA